MSRFTFLILLLLILTGIYFWMMRASYLGQFLSKQLNTTVSVTSVDFKNKQIVIRGLRIENPTHSKHPYAFQVDTIELEIDPLRLFNKQLFIRHMTLLNPLLDLELFNGAGNENNWTHFLKALPEASQNFLVIHRLRLDNLKIDVTRSYGKPLTLPSIPMLEFDQWGKQSSLSIPETSRLLFQTILMTLSTKPHLGAILDDVEGLPHNLLKAPAEEPNMLQGGMDLIRKKTQEAGEFLQGLFGITTFINFELI